MFSYTAVAQPYTLLGKTKYPVSWKQVSQHMLRGFYNQCKVEFNGGKLNEMLKFWILAAPVENDAGLQTQLQSDVRKAHA